jgi:hypothetical protein
VRHYSSIRPTNEPAFYAWPAALTIAAIIVVVEVLPLILGMGEEAIVDWSFFYVTFRFILLPLASLLHLLVNTVLLVARRKRPLATRLVEFSSVVVSAGFLAVSYFYPLPFSKPLM